MELLKKVVREPDLRRCNLGKAVEGHCWQLTQWKETRDEEDTLKLYLETNVCAF